MKMKLLLSLLLLTLFSCGPSRNKDADRIHMMESRLFSSTVTSLNKESADSLLVLYTAFIKNFPSDTLSQKYIFKAANLYLNTGQGKQAIEMFGIYRADYPNDPKAAICLFFTAYVYENLLQNLDKAQETYILFIEKYPRHDFADDAQMALNNLGKSPDQIVKDFEQKKRADSARVADSLKRTHKKK